MFDYSDHLEDFEEILYRKPRKRPKRSRADLRLPPPAAVAPITWQQNC